jgi:probable HAF family extracellular repeat protein
MANGAAAGHVVEKRGESRGYGGHSMRFVWALVALAGLVLALTLPALAQTYTVINLGTLGGDSSEASAINNRGEVVGRSKTGAGQTHGFVYRAGVMVDLGTLADGTYSHATAINDRSQVLGYGGINAYAPQFAEHMNSFFWENGSMRAFNGFYCPCGFGERHSTAATYGVSGATLAAGVAKSMRGVLHAYRWVDDAMSDVVGSPSSLSTSTAYGVNDRGQIVGERDGRAFLCQNGETLDLGTLPGDRASRARGINASGQVIGESIAADGASRAILWQAGAMVAVGTLPGDVTSRARGINASAQVIGESVAADGTSRAFLWKNGAMSDLNTSIPPGSGWVLTTASAINDAGQISGAGLYNGRTRAFLLAPVKRVPSAPTSLILLR